MPAVRRLTPLLIAVLTLGHLLPSAVAASSDAALVIVAQYGAPQNCLEARLLADAQRGRLQAFTPLGAALVASGVEDDATLRAYERKATALADELQHSVILTGTPRKRIESIFGFLQRQVLVGGYDLGCTDLRRLLDEGRFNCISASVMFNYLAGRCGFECRGLEMPAHSMSRVILAEGPLDIETTCPSWFGKANSLRDTSWRATACAGRSVREVTPLQMAAMIYYNRGVDLLGDKRFAEAAACNAKALRLDPQNATARGNLLATINNWSIDLGNQGHYAEAIDLLRRGLSIDPSYAALSQNFVHVHHQWVDNLCHNGQYEAAFTVLSRASSELPNREYLRDAQRQVRERWTAAAAFSGRSAPIAPGTMPCVNTTAASLESE
jgi:tetratricopeptide (TPR) repeat protein